MKGYELSPEARETSGKFGYILLATALVRPTNSKRTFTQLASCFLKTLI
jgi:hypothetical protein